MNKLVIACALFAVAMAAPSTFPAGHAVIRNLPALQHEEIHDDYGQYALRYVTAEGTIVSERGRLVPNPDGPGHVLLTDGEVSYMGEDGKRYETKYTAGLDGFKAEGTHFPVAPEPLPVPEVIMPVAPVAIVAA